MKNNKQMQPFSDKARYLIDEREAHVEFTNYPCWEKIPPKTISGGQENE